MASFTPVINKESYGGRGRETQTFTGKTTYGDAFHHGRNMPPYKAPVPVGTFSGRPLSAPAQPAGAAGLPPRRTHATPMFQHSTATLANNDVEVFWQGAAKDPRITQDVLNRTRARDNKAASTISSIRNDMYLRTRYAPGARHAPPASSYVTQYQMKFDLNLGHAEKTELIAQKALYPVRFAERPVTAREMGAANKFNSRRANVRLDQDA
mmetsp:Transcript_4324/g.10500  ORF Transcript_4324/g.10500 Transcript_4324/m.10500 type:complete len:210 (+) Transcript_4324:218-847(+)|eukprot:CAMPEP_0197588544 /NCGR_PEP_ID=MMETSP1326-20131121/9794_1 /TAXON_ID=1155430 /ORGANISM="Genus nov. species nov., Strain RCC2288" /LENGTH=209 /DNA_ID=CAMNT_0043153387 /DNA_START=215 /DNA_END=844 /DNA_ORIENTATION=+